MCVIAIEGLRERTEYIDIFLFSTHHSTVFCFRYSVYWCLLVKPVTRQNISSCSVLSPKIVMHDDTYISGRSENNIKCIVHDDLG